MEAPAAASYGGLDTTSPGKDKPSTMIGHQSPAKQKPDPGLPAKSLFSGLGGWGGSGGEEAGGGAAVPRGDESGAGGAGGAGAGAEATTRSPGLVPESAPAEAPQPPAAAAAPEAESDPELADLAEVRASGGGPRELGAKPWEGGGGSP